jgi:hypothetical protein
LKKTEAGNFTFGRPGSAQADLDHSSELSRRRTACGFFVPNTPPTHQL